MQTLKIPTGRSTRNQLILYQMFPSDSRLYIYTVITFNKLVHHKINLPHCQFWQFSWSLQPISSPEKFSRPKLLIYIYIYKFDKTETVGGSNIPPTEELQSHVQRLQNEIVIRLLPQPQHKDCSMMGKLISINWHPSQEI